MNRSVGQRSISDFEKKLGKFAAAPRLPWPLRNAVRKYEKFSDLDIKVLHCESNFIILKI